MPKVKILINGSPVEVEETSAGLFGKLGYQYVGQQTTPTVKQPVVPTPQPAQQIVQSASKVVPQPATQIVQQAQPTVQQPVQAPSYSSQQVSGSVVDYLKSKGFSTPAGEKYPLFDTRGQLYSALGLSGSYIGSADQNSQLLRELQRVETNAGVSLNQNNVMQAIRAYKNQTTPTQTQSGDAQQIITQASQKIQEIQSSLNTIEQAKNAGLKVDANTTVQEATQFLQGKGQETTPTTNGEMTAEELMKQAEEEYFGTAEYQLRQDKAQAEKEKIKLKAQRDTETLIQSLASKGLTFSGIRDKQVSQIEVDKLAELIGIDRSFALIVAQGLTDTAEKIAKEAEKGNAQALSALEKLGYTVNPLTGKVEETLENKRYQLSAQQASEPSTSNIITTTVNGKRVLVDKSTGSITSVLGNAGGTSEAIKNVYGASLNTRLEAEVKNLYAGFYGEDTDALNGLISKLQYEFPNIAVEDLATIVENRVPENWTKNITDKRYTSSNIPQDVLLDIRDDIDNQATLNELYIAYPEVSPSFLESLYYSY